MLYFVLGVYVAIMVAIGITTSLKTKTIQDFFLGNRTVGPWISAFAYGTTYFSAVLFIGYAGGQGWSFGLPVLWVALGNAFIGCLLPWLVLGRRTRIMTGQLGVMTMPEFLEARYGSKALKIVSALIIFIFLIPYSAAAYTGLSYLFQAIFGIEYLYALIGMAALTTFYLVLGGYFAVTLTDFVQGLVMLVGAVLMVGFVFRSPVVGGFGQFLPRLARISPELVKVFPASMPKVLWLVTLTSFGVWGMPQMVQKFYAIKSEKMILRAMVIGTIFCLVIAGAAYLVGSTTSLFGPALVQENKQFATAPNYAAAQTDPLEARALVNLGMKNDAEKNQDPVKYGNTMIIPQVLKRTLPETPSFDYPDPRALGHHVHRVIPGTGLQFRYYHRPFAGRTLARDHEAHQYGGHARPLCCLRCALGLPGLARPELPRGSDVLFLGHHCRRLPRSLRPGALLEACNQAGRLGGYGHRRVRLLIQLRWRHVRVLRCDQGGRPHVRHVGHGGLPIGRGAGQSGDGQYPRRLWSTRHSPPPRQPRT